MIGVIGGNGVAATNRLCQLIEEIYTKNGAFRDAHHPEMLIWQATQVPSRSMYLEGRGESFIPGYVDCGLKLKACGCTELCMCCNTAHYAIEELQVKIGLPFVNILEEVAKTVHCNGYKKAAILCSDGCAKFKLYDKAFAKYAPEVELVYPDEEHQAMVTRGICNAKNQHRNDSGYSKELPKNIYSTVCDWFVSHGLIGDGDCIVGGCTDINAVFCPDSWKGLGYVDSLCVLALSIFNKSKQQ